MEASKGKGSGSKIKVSTKKRFPRRPRVAREVAEKVLKRALEDNISVAAAARQIRKVHKDYSEKQLTKAAYKLRQKAGAVEEPLENVAESCHDENQVRRIITNGVDILLRMIQERDAQIVALNAKCEELTTQNKSLLEVQKTDKVRIAQLVGDYQAAEQLLFDEKCVSCPIKKSLCTP